MKIIKIIIILITGLIITGCNVEYNVEIDENGIATQLETNIINDEYIKNAPNSEFNNVTNLEYFTNLEIPKYYNDTTINQEKNINTLDGSSVITYSDQYSFEDFENSYFAHACFENMNYLYEDNKLYIHFYGKFNCYYGETDINIKTNYSILNGNYTERSGNVYKWKINDDNKDNIDITFLISQNNNKINVAFIIILVIVIVLSVITFILYRFIKKGNL